MTAITRLISRPTPFETNHSIEYGLRIINRDPDTGDVESVRCQFCVYCGRENEEEVGKKRKRQPTAKVMDWNYPFRTSYFVNHHMEQHRTAWEVYQALSHEQKQSFFENNQSNEALNYHFESPNNPLVHKIDASIVDIIIANMFFHPFKHGGISQRNALFKMDPSGQYILTITNKLQFRLIVDYISVGCSFRQVAQVLDITKKHTGMSRIGTINDTQVANIARAICAINIQMIVQMLRNNKSTWAWSFVNYSSTYFGKSYLDSRIRIHLDGTIYNLHVIAIPTHEPSHTGQYMFNLIVKVFDILCPDWRIELLGIGSDGANTMIGEYQGVVTRLEQQLQHKIYRVWCGLHQLDLVMKEAFKNLMDGEVVSIMNAWIIHLRSQGKVISEMQATSPKPTTRWVGMGDVCTWLLDKQVALSKLIAENKLSAKLAPESWWWIVIAGIKGITDHVNPIFIKLQSRELLAAQQADILAKLAADISTDVGVDGPLNPEELDYIQETAGDNCTCYGCWSVGHEAIVNYLSNLGYMHVRHALNGNDLTPQLRHKIISVIANLVLRILEGILAIQIEQERKNPPADDLPPVLPHSLVKIRTAELGAILDTHLPQLKHSWDDQSIANIEDQHRALCAAYRNELALRAALDKCDGATTFEAGWSIVQGRFNDLRDFCGGIATVFPNTDSVKSDFSVQGWEKDGYRKSLTDLSLEGIMHCKQYELLSDLGFK